MDGDTDDYVFIGTPIEREEDTSARKRKAVADAGQMRSLPVWKQEVRDEEGRKRFHGAFTGGFSAGFYNTVGSKEGWTPQTFTSSRKNRAEKKQQTIYNYLDDEDMKDMGGHALETSLQFDTFGFTAAEHARKQADKEQEKRPSTIPGPVPDELILPAANSIGYQLLLKMGWRRGHSIKETHADSLYDARREARKAFLAFSATDGTSQLSPLESSQPASEDYTAKFNDGSYTSQNTPVYVLHPKEDLHGLGYDPFKHAPEFRDRKRSRESINKDQGNRSVFATKKNVLASNSAKYAPGFGIGALEELDVEDEDIYASGFEFVESEVEEEEPSRAVRDTKHKLESRKQGVLSGFRVASSTDYNLERFNPPVIPSDFEPFHKFKSPLEAMSKYNETPPLEVPPPEDNNLRLLIDGVATLVARCGKLFEDLSREKNKSNPMFSFLDGGNGHTYYLRKLWEEKKRNINLQRQGDIKTIPSVQKMTAESRGRILGERPLEKSSNKSSSYVTSKKVIQLQSNLSDTFTKPVSLVGLSEAVKPFKSDPAKQKRFEQFIKDKYQGGLRSMYSGSTDIMSETDRARERLDFEAAAEAIEKGQWNEKNNHPSIQQNVEFVRTEKGTFLSAGEGLTKISHDEGKTEKKINPKREEFQWRPSPILCKRFDITDPFMGKPPPVPRSRSKMDSLIFTADSVMSTKSEVTDAPKRDLPLVTESESQGTGNLQGEMEPDTMQETTSVQRPVDLYKAIFSDDSDDDGDDAGSGQVDISDKKSDGSNTTVNRLIADDFLESIGKELGIEVPMDQPIPLNLTNNFTSMENTGRGIAKSTSQKEVSTSKLEISYTHSEVKEATGSKSWSPEGFRSVQGETFVLAGKEATSIDGDGPNHGKSKKGNLGTHSYEEVVDGRSTDHKDGKAEKEHRSRKHTHSRQHRRYSSSSDTDSSSHSYRSRSRADKRTLSARKSRKHTGYPKHKRNRSPGSYSSDDSDRDIRDSVGRDKKSRNRESHSSYSKSHSRKKYR